MTVKKQLNDTNYVLQNSAKSRQFVVHVDQMRRFHSDLSTDGVQEDPQHTTPDSDTLQEL